MHLHNISVTEMRREDPGITMPKYLAEAKKVLRGERLSTFKALYYLYKHF